MLNIYFPVWNTYEFFSHPENPCHPRAKPEWDMNPGWTNHKNWLISRQFIVNFTENEKSMTFKCNMVQGIATKHYQETDVWRETRQLFHVHVTSLNQSYFAICLINYMKYNTFSKKSIIRIPLIVIVIFKNDLSIRGGCRSLKLLL